MKALYSWSCKACGCTSTPPLRPRSVLMCTNCTLDFMLRVLQRMSFICYLTERLTCLKFQSWKHKPSFFKPLNANFTKWSNTLKQFVGRLPTNCLSVFDYFVGLGLKGLKRILIAKLIFFRFHSFDLYVKIDFFSVNSTLVLKSCFYLILLRFHLLWFLIWKLTVHHRKPDSKWPQAYCQT